MFLKQLYSCILKYILDVLSVMTPPTSWNKDALMIMVPRWTSMLSDLSRRVLEQTSHGASGQNNNESQQSKIECPTFYDYDDFATLIPSEMTFAPDMASSHINSNEESTELKTLTLANGVKLPVMGLGTLLHFLSYTDNNQITILCVFRGFQEHGF